ncbi:peptidoglycan DD-metalloendopeptidase family protein [Patescibacteria group bacterium]
MRKAFSFFIIILLFFAGYWFFFRSTDSETQAVEEIIQEIIPEPVEINKEHVIEDGDTFTKAMDTLGFDYSTALEILEAAKEVYDFTSVKIGRPLRVVSVDGVQDRLEYETGTENVIVVDLDDNFETRQNKIEYEVTIEKGEATIESSMFVAGLEVGLDEVLMLDFAQIFAWTVDFAVAVQEGDSFKVMYEKRTRDGQEAGVGDILALSFTNQGETYYGYLFHNKDGDKAYYDHEGNSLIRQFLKAPLSYNRISSGYTYARFHPVAHLTGPHRAIDYAAPIGTPIKAVGDGTITAYGWNGGFGNYVDIHHNETYATQYAHLSAYVKGLGIGSKVKQGDVIGYVGSTGWSTGPHLHYQMKVNGELIDPTKLELPAGDPIEDDRREEFETERDRLKAELEK